MLCGSAVQRAFPVLAKRHLMPNKPVKGTRRPLAVLKVWFLSRFGGFA